MKNLRKYILIVVCGVLATSSTFMTVETATSGVEVSNLQKEETQLSDEKRYLQDLLVKTMSLSQLQERSSGLGYVKPVTLIYVAPPEAVAKLP